MTEGSKGSSKKYMKLLLLIIIIFYAQPCSAVKASASLPEDINYTEIQDVINDVMGKGNEFQFDDYVDQLISGEEAFTISSLGNQLLHSVKGEINANLGTFGSLITIALIAALFTNLSMAFKNNHVSETGYYITYLLLFSLLISTFILASRIAAETIGSILDFMKALVPTYLMVVGFYTGSGTSLVYYEAALMLITLVDFLMVSIMIPMINFYLIIMLTNNLSKEDMLSKLAELFSSAISWLLKSMLAAVIGFNAIQGLIVPVADKVKRSTLLKASEALPGVGDALGGVAETILGAGVLLKNAIGVAGLIVILTICAVPFLKLLMITVVYKVGCAALQPISDKRFIECISASAKSAGMLLQTVFVGAVLFIITITIVAVTTGGIS
ncbi:stage III sporulation protein AE [Lachnospiraceae bacterium MD1]|uniref:Stage III sporulation protein AE n=1 Tax=Variimorphobacter saccharofermentans TaxID=2755051 RepID=A0A839JXI2_9FIRM|nr:stage III sporulation protein AE [Variimorphobacter saccharofermentans]MBB2182385.1 stage III sporulation protein AE [Variimorphobacter saccharofermentans]